MSHHAEQSFSSRPTRRRRTNSSKTLSFTNKASDTEESVEGHCFTYKADNIEERLRHQLGYKGREEHVRGYALGSVRFGNQVKTGISPRASSTSAPYEAAPLQDSDAAALIWSSMPAEIFGNILGQLSASSSPVRYKSQLLALRLVHTSWNTQLSANTATHLSMYGASGRDTPAQCLEQAEARLASDRINRRNQSPKLKWTKPVVAAHQHVDGRRIKYDHKLGHLDPVRLNISIRPGRAEHLGPTIYRRTLTCDVPVASLPDIEQFRNDLHAWTRLIEMEPLGTGTTCLDDLDENSGQTVFHAKIYDLLGVVLPKIEKLPAVQYGSQVGKPDHCTLTIDFKGSRRHLTVVLNSLNTDLSPTYEEAIAFIGNRQFTLPDSIPIQLLRHNLPATLSESDQRYRLAVYVLYRAYDAGKTSSTEFGFADAAEQEILRFLVPECLPCTDPQITLKHWASAPTLVYIVSRGNSSTPWEEACLSSKTWDDLDEEDAAELRQRIADSQAHLSGEMTVPQIAKIVLEELGEFAQSFVPWAGAAFVKAVHEREASRGSWVFALSLPERILGYRLRAVCRGRNLVDQDDVGGRHLPTSEVEALLPRLISTGIVKRDGYSTYRCAYFGTALITIDAAGKIVYGNLSTLSVDHVFQTCIGSVNLLHGKFTVQYEHNAAQNHVVTSQASQFASHRYPPGLFGLVANFIVAMENEQLSAADKKMLAVRLVRLVKAYYPTWKIPCPMHHRLVMPPSHYVQSRQKEAFLRQALEIEFYLAIPAWDDDLSHEAKNGVRIAVADELTRKEEVTAAAFPVRPGKLASLPLPSTWSGILEDLKILSVQLNKNFIKSLNISYETNADGVLSMTVEHTEATMDIAKELQRTLVAASSWERANPLVVFAQIFCAHAHVVTDGVRANSLTKIYYSDPYLLGLPLVSQSKGMLALSPSRLNHDLPHQLGFLPQTPLADLTYTKWDSARSNVAGGTWFTNAFMRGDEEECSAQVSSLVGQMRGFYTEEKLSWVFKKWAEDGSDGRATRFEKIIKTLVDEDAFARVE